MEVDKLISKRKYPFFFFYASVLKRLANAASGTKIKVFFKNIPFHCHCANNIFSPTHFSGIRIVLYLLKLSIFFLSWSLCGEEPHRNNILDRNEELSKHKHLLHHWDKFLLSNFIFFWKNWPFFFFFYCCWHICVKKPHQYSIWNKLRSLKNTRVRLHHWANPTFLHFLFWKKGSHRSPVSISVWMKCFVGTVVLFIFLCSQDGCSKGLQSIMGQVTACQNNQCLFFLSFFLSFSFCAWFDIRSRLQTCQGWLD